VVHRLTGCKLLAVADAGGENSIIETVDPESLRTDAPCQHHCRLALDDGKTIARRRRRCLRKSRSRNLLRRARRAGCGRDAVAIMFAPPRIEPDLTVITGNGQKSART